MPARSARVATAGLVGLAIVLAVGLTELYRLRFAAGDVYPYASSLRADPLGTKALHDALLEMPGLTVERNLRPLADLPVDRETVVLILGLQSRDLEAPSEPLVHDAEALARRGARVVLAYEPRAEGPRTHDPAEPHSTSVAIERTSARLSPRWIDLPEGAAGRPAAASAKRESGLADLPEELTLHTALVFDREAVDARTQAVYRRDGYPVLLERRLAPGSLVIAADGFPFANEGVYRERQTALLAWALGGAHRVVFDESHLGVEESSGVMVLARRYRLVPVLAVLAVLAALFVWQATSSLVPAPADSRSDDDLVAGGNAAAGLAKLLARGIAPRDVLAQCAERWTHDCARGQEAAARIVADLARSAHDPVAGHREIRDTLARLSPRRGDHVR